MFGEKCRNPWQGGYEVLRELCMGRMPDDDQHGHAVVDHGSEFVGLVANAGVMCNHNPAALTDGLQPGFVRTVVCKMVAVPLDHHTCGGKDVRKALPEIAVGEKDRAQAARS